MSLVDRIRTFPAAAEVPFALTIGTAEALSNRRINQVQLCQAHGLTVVSPNVLSLPEDIHNVMEKILVSAAPAVAPTEADSFDSELAVITDLASKHKDSAKIVTFCKKQVEAARKDPKNLKTTTQELLGMVIYLLNHALDDTATLITQRYYVSSAQSYLLDAFRKSIAARSMDLSAILDQEQNLGIIDPENFYAIELPKLIAELLITPSGYFNLSIADVVMNCLFHKEKLDCEKRISDLIKEYNEDPALIALLLAAKAPADQKSVAAELIRASCGLSEDTPVTDVEAKRAHLAAQLTIGWESNYTYHTTSVAKLLQIYRPEKTGQDFNELLATGTLSRKNAVVTLPEVILSNYLEAEICLDSDNAIWESTTIQQIGTSMGIEEEKLPEMVRAVIAEHMPQPEEVVEEVKAETPATDAVVADKEAPLQEAAAADKVEASEVEEEATLTVNQLIHGLAQSFDPEQAALKVALAQKAFSATFSNPLVSAWEECLVEIAEANPSKLVRGKILQAVQMSLQNKFQPKNVQAEKIVTKFFNELMQDVNRRLVLEINRDAEKTEDQSAITMKDIKDVEGFRSFLWDSHFTAYSKVAKEVAVQADRDAIDRINDVMPAYLQSEPFMNSVLRTFDPADKTNTPWNAKVTNDAFDVLSAALDQEDLATELGVVANAQTLYEQLIGYAKQAGDLKDVKLQLATPEHAFTFFPNALATEKSAEESIKEYMAGFDTTAAPSRTERNQIVAWAEKRLVHTADKQQFATIVKNKLAVDLPVKAFRDQLISLAKGVADDHARAQFSESEMATMLDKRLIKALYHNESKELTAEAKEFLKPMHIADTHLEHRSKNVHLCLYRSPITASVQLGLVAADDSFLLPLKQGEWVDNKEWKMTKISLNIPA